MPERVWLKQDGTWALVSGTAALTHITFYVPESRALDAEARAKAMEDGPLDYMSGKCDRLKEENATLRAERDALVAEVARYKELLLTMEMPNA